MLHEYTAFAEIVRVLNYGHHTVTHDDTNHLWTVIHLVAETGYKFSKIKHIYDPTLRVCGGGGGGV